MNIDKIKKAINEIAKEKGWYAVNFIYYINKLKKHWLNFTRRRVDLNMNIQKKQLIRQRVRFIRKSKGKSHVDIFIRQHMGIAGKNPGQYGCCGYSLLKIRQRIINNRTR